MIADPKIVLVVARARNGVIGDRGQMPWRIRSEMALFKRLTMGKPCLMGRKTWDGLYVKPLPGRPCLVLTRDAAWSAPGAEAFTDFDAMLARGRALAQETGADEIAVIGGEALFRLALPAAGRLYLTEVALDAAGDVFFPEFDEGAWRETRAEPGGGAMSGDGEPEWRLRVLDRVA